MAVASYALSFIATILGLIEPFGKKMKTILAFNFIGNFLVGCSYLMVSEKSGMAICFVACVLVFVNYGFNLKEKKIPAWLVFLYLLTFLSVNLLTFVCWYDIFSLIASVLFVISVTQNVAKYYRILYFMNSMVWIVYDFLAGAYGNLLTHIVLFVATFISILMRNKENVSQ